MVISRDADNGFLALITFSAEDTDTDTDTDTGNLHTQNRTCGDLAIIKIECECRSCILVKSLNGKAVHVCCLTEKHYMFLNDAFERYRG